MSKTSNPNRPSQRHQIDMKSLAVLNRLGDIGIGGIEQRLQGLKHDANVVSEQVAHGFARRDLLDVTFEDTERVGVKMKLPGAPFGFAVVWFPMASANNAARMMLQEGLAPGETPSHKMARSAITELGAMVAAGFVDAWADTFEQEIDVGAPSPVQATEQALVNTVLDEGEDLGLYVSSAVRLPAYDISLNVLLFPRNAVMLKILDRIDVRRVRP
ncbi:chemotaxis protein CheC [Halomarina rubra]|uniref:Chemotaxis protein CheC n=1 Tax=Halomarina rubra TaxID=2071873 RepID=A0ABD6AV59_9EURY|nr:chemotaxis protein CheC [Halomarina rubra]